MSNIFCDISGVVGAIIEQIIGQVLGDYCLSLQILQYKNYKTKKTDKYLSVFFINQTTKIIIEELPPQSHNPPLFH
jgi:hypothetical protein